MTVAEALAIKEKIEIANIVEKLGGFTFKTVPSDKIGFDWVETYLGDKLVKQEYVEQENPMGTADNPYIYVEGETPLINNAYYLIDGVRYVYMSGEFVEF